MVHKRYKQFHRAHHDGGGVTNYTDPRISPVRDYGRSGRRLVVRDNSAPIQSGASRRQGSSPTTPARASAIRTGLRPVRTAPCGSLTLQPTPSDASRRRGPSATTPERASVVRPGSRPAPTAPCGSRTLQITPSDASRREGSSATTPERASAIRTGSPPVPTAPCGSLTLGRKEGLQ